MPGIRNPIHLARLVLDHSTKPLSLRRVPPNLIVGPGATDFASELGLPIVLPDFLVSTAAGERYARWKQDLNKVSSYEDSETDIESESLASRSEGQEDIAKRDAHNVELAGCWNESQPYSPRVVPTDSAHPETTYEVAYTTEPPRRRSYWSSNEPGNDGQSSIKVRAVDDDSEDSSIDDSHSFQLRASRRILKDTSSGQLSSTLTLSEDSGCQLPSPLIQPPPTRIASPSSLSDPSEEHSLRLDEMVNNSDRPDDITDTVGAIAIDYLGNVAAGSSSGGIGMKHKGRVGPAALVGIGTAVIPLEPEDKDKTSVAIVTSGTGEHMATTMAAGVCASRLYSSTRRTRKGGSESTDDDNAIRSFVERDFMGKSSPILLLHFLTNEPFIGHPSVKYSHSAGAIGILGIKKTVHGIALYFAHNTDSFVSSYRADNGSGEYLGG